jgi:biopolymer transport protein ExbD
MPRKESDLADKIDINMTPMIDIVFQLLAFFIMSLKIIDAEGDFDVRMPLSSAAAAAPDDQQVPPVRVRLASDESGKLAGISMNGTPLRDLDELRKRLIELVGDETGPNSLADKTEVELDCDPSLHYDFVVKAITAVSGREQGGQMVELVKKIKFTPPKQ